MNMGHRSDGLKNRLPSMATNEDFVYVRQLRRISRSRAPSHMCTASRKLSMDSNKLHAYKFLKSQRHLYQQPIQICSDILKKFGFDSCSPKTLANASVTNLDEEKGGKLIDPTRFSVAKPTDMHLTAIKRIFRYLKGTIHMAGPPKSRKVLPHPQLRLNNIALSGCCAQTSGMHSQLRDNGFAVQQNSDVL
ncbi:hypothetical protein Tco_1227566 [Tanacetum coccineum]